MGIKGLSSYLSTNCQKYEAKVRISRRVVIVDGSNLMFFLYLSSDELLKSGHHIFGGDTACYAQCVRAYFQKLKCCSILPIVIFDGAYEDIKQNEKMRRFTDSLRRNVKDSGQPGKSYTPIFLRDVFISVLVEQDILHFQTEYEADDTIAYAAKQLGDCPILSSDSDFYMCINSIVINLSTVTFKKLTTSCSKENRLPSTFPPSTHYLGGKTIKMRDFATKELKLAEPRLLPLAAVAIGNDFVSKCVFETFFSQCYKTSLQTLGNSFRIDFLLKWFAKQPSFEAALEKLLDSVKEDFREGLRVMINKIVNNYMGAGGDMATWKLIKSSAPVRNLIESEEALENCDHQLEQSEISDIVESLDELNFGESESDNLEDNGIEADLDEDFQPLLRTNSERITVPDWFLLANLKCDYPHAISTILYNRRVYLSPQVEVAHMPSSHAISVQIIQAIAGLLFGQGEVTLVSRDRYSPAVIQVPSMASILSKYEVPCVMQSEADIRISWNSEKRLNILFDSLSLSSSDKEFTHEWPPYLKIWISTALFFVRKLRHTEKARLAISTAIAVILGCLSSYSFEGALQNIDERPLLTQRVAILLKMQRNDAPLRKFFKDYTDPPNTSHKKFFNSYNIEQVYTFSQFQSCTYFVNALNSLLGWPLRCSQLSALNCYVVYNVCLTSQKHGGLLSGFLDTVLPATSPLRIALEKFTSFALQGSVQLLPDVSNPTAFKKKSKSQKRIQMDEKVNRNRFLAFAEGSGGSLLTSENKTGSSKDITDRQRSVTSCVERDDADAPTEAPACLCADDIDEFTVNKIKTALGIESLRGMGSQSKGGGGQNTTCPKIISALQKNLPQGLQESIFGRLIHELCSTLPTPRLDIMKSRIEEIAREVLKRDRKIRKKESKERKRLAKKAEESPLERETAPSLHQQHKEEALQSEDDRGWICDTGILAKIVVNEAHHLEFSEPNNFQVEALILELCTLMSGQRLHALSLDVSQSCVNEKKNKEI